MNVWVGEGVNMWVGEGVDRNREKSRLSREGKAGDIAQGETKAGPKGMLGKS